jgi:hypothetical protein
MFGKVGAMVIVFVVTITGTALATNYINEDTLARRSFEEPKQAESWRGDNQLLWLVGGGIIVDGVILVATAKHEDKCVSRTCASLIHQLQNQ